MFATIELFAGAGGLALGIEKAGFNTIGIRNDLAEGTEYVFPKHQYHMIPSSKN